MRRKKPRKRLSAAQRKVFPYFFFGFRPASSARGEIASHSRKKPKLAMKSASASYDAFYRLDESRAGGFAVALCAHDEA